MQHFASQHSASQHSASFSSYPINVLVVEDEKDLCEAMVDYLSLDGMQVTSAATLAQAEDILARFPVDILVLDLGLGEDDGLVWIRQRRDVLRQCGLIMATASGQQEDRILGAQAGADVYVTKPFALEELSVLIINLYQTLNSGDMPLCWTLMYIPGCLKAPNGQQVKLSFAEKLMLETLVAHAPEVCPREVFIEALGEDATSFDPRRLETMCRRLKQRVMEDTGYELPIETVHAQGYRLTAPILLDEG